MQGCGKIFTARSPSLSVEIVCGQFILRFILMGRAASALGKTSKTFIVLFIYLCEHTVCSVQDQGESRRLISTTKVCTN